MFEVVFSVDINCGGSGGEQGALCPIGKCLGEKVLSDLCEDASVILDTVLTNMWNGKV